MDDNCKITVRDDCIVKDPSKVEKVIERVSQIVLGEIKKNAKDNTA